MTDQKNALEKAHRIIEEFRKLDENMPIQQAAVFLAVAFNNDASQKEIAEFAGLGQGSASRNLSAFLKTNRFKRPGFNVIENEHDPMELRIKRHRLNKKGVRIAQTIADIIKK